jgi:predicted SprT family Zn-dependent metalloprotease
MTRPRHKTESWWQAAPETAELVRQRLAALDLGSMARQVRVYWNPRMRTTAGVARPWDNTILLNPRLREISPEEIHRTLLHELAHLLVHWRYPRRRVPQHGAEWRQACADLGIPGERARHSLPWEKTRQTRRWKYTCRHCGLAIHRVRRLRHAAACLPCCRQFNRGRFDPRFQLLEEKLPG